MLNSPPTPCDRRPPPPFVHCSFSHRLYKMICPLVCWSIGSFVNVAVCPSSHLLVMHFRLFLCVWGGVGACTPCPHVKYCLILSHRVTSYNYLWLLIIFLSSSDLDWAAWRWLHFPYEFVIIPPPPKKKAKKSCWNWHRYLMLFWSYWTEFFSGAYD